MYTVTIEPYETIYSWVTRIHRKRGSMDLALTNRELFKQASVHIHPYLPNQLARLAHATRTDSNQLIRYHTLFPLFHYFVPLGDLFYNGMKFGRKPVSRALKLPSTGFSQANHYRFCPVCTKEMRLTTGVVIIDIRHQLPGVEGCFKHVCHLNSIETSKVFDRELLSPLTVSPINPCLPKTHAFACFCTEFLALAVETNSVFDLVVYKGELERQGFFNESGRLLVGKVGRALLDFYDDLELSQEMGNGFSIRSLSRLFNQHHDYYIHPLFHMLLAFWLFDGDVQKFKWHDSTAGLIDLLDF